VSSASSLASTTQGNSPTGHASDLRWHFANQVFASTAGWRSFNFQRNASNATRSDFRRHIFLDCLNLQADKNRHAYLQSRRRLFVCGPSRLLKALILVLV
jgi:hypothetical protein